MGLVDAARLLRSQVSSPRRALELSSSGWHDTLENEPAFELFSGLRSLRNGVVALGGVGW